MKTFQEFQEAYSQAERQSHVKPRPVDVETVTRKTKDMGKNFYYKDVLPNYQLRHNTPIIPTNKTKSNRGLEV